MLYDVLLLLIYNVNSPVSVCAGYLGEYLLNMYKELNIDLDSFASFTLNTMHAEHEDE